MYLTKVSNRILRERRKLMQGVILSHQYLNTLHTTLDDDFNKHLKSFCMFIGYPRSGHSLVGSLIDAHPNTLISHELDVMKLLQIGFSKTQIFSLIYQNSHQFATFGRQWSGYMYEVPNQWQGSFNQLKIIGDKRGSGTLVRLCQAPELLNLFKQTMGIPIKFIHVVRNPYDNISTISIKHQFSINKSIEIYFKLCNAYKKISGFDDINILDIKHEDLIENPYITMKRICYFLGIDAEENYLKSCASIVFKSPHKTRYKINWSKRLINDVHDQLSQYSFLADYNYKS